MGRLIKIACLLLLVTSCCPCKEAVSKQNVKIKDSVNVRTETRIKDSLVFTPASKSTVTITVPCPDVKPVSKKNNNATSTFEIKNGVAKADCFCDSLGIIQRTKETIEKQYKEHLNDSKTTQIIEKKYIPVWVKILAGMGLLPIVYLIYKLIKYFK
jgi:hypothetical protein